MAKPSSLFALLEAREEVSYKFHKDAVDDSIKNPQEIGALTEESVKADILSFITTSSDRLARFFCDLRLTVQQNPRSQNSGTIATETISLLIDVLPYLHPLLDPHKVLDFLIPALNVCFVPSQRPVMRELASVIASSGNLLEHLVCDHLGVEIIREWVSIQNKNALDVGTSELWTERLVSMMRACIMNHDITLECQRWHMLKAVKQSLQNIQSSFLWSSSEGLTSASSQKFPVLGAMKKLNREDKKGQIAKHPNAESTFPSLKDDDKKILESFSINIPGSKHSLTETIKKLEGETTNTILHSIIPRDPCYLCLSSLGDSYQQSKDQRYNEDFQAVSASYMDSLNKGFGLWKILLSPPALKSVLHMKSQELVQSVTKRLREIASGCWQFQSQTRAGLKHQRQRLKVPVVKTSCVLNHFILWQIVVETDAGTGLVQQGIKVWEVCDYSEISKILDRVIFLHQSYSDETVRRCKQQSAPVDGTQIPIRFQDSASHPITSARPSANFDIRTVDQDIIEMTNKFYTLTEPVMRSILANDISAEFPFDLSHEEALVIRHFQTASLILGRSGTGKTTCLVFKLVGKFLARNVVADQKPVQQILLTRSPFLADKLQSYTRRLIQTLLSKSDSLQLSELASSISVEEDLRKRTVFSLSDASFPLICTWEDFLTMLENTAAKLCRRTSYDLEMPPNQRGDEIIDTKRSLRCQFIDFHVFQSDYWPHFSHALTKDFSVHLIFSEIMGVIKGSASSRESLEPLRRDEYLARSCRLAPTFKEGPERSRVYDVFEMYQKLKLEQGGVDQIDRVVKLLRLVGQDPSLKRLLRLKFDEVYIDEIQDHRCLDVELLLNFIKDGRGFHFAGDTAQAISQDSNFRFSDIKGLFYEHFASASATTHQTELCRPKLFTLSKNYRSHQGILALASFIMSMIWKAFPETVDKLEPEIGNLNGPKPVLFRGVESNILLSNDIGHVTLSAGTGDFGAEQVILVRDSRTKEHLQNKIGVSALVLTILESKGMEFDDVLLWNFFTDCPDQLGLRRLESLVKETASFDTGRHSGMCSELKHLYVAITRARVGLFIMETSEATAATVLRVLDEDTPTPLIDVTSPTHKDFRMRLEMLRPGTSLDPKQWSRRGAELLHRRMYKDALRCFRKAHDGCGETTAEGHLREEEGRFCSATNDNEGFIRNLTLAVQCFLKVSLINDAVRNFVALGKPEDAAKILFENKMFSEAARYFVDSGLSTKAIECHHLAGEFTEAAAIMNKERDYDRLVEYLHENREKIPASTLQGYGRICKLLLKQNRISDKHRQYGIGLLGSSEEQEQCFREYGMDDDLGRLFATQSRHEDNFHLYFGKGDLDRAFEIAITGDLLQSHADHLQAEILGLMDYYWVGQLEKNRSQHSTTPLHLPSGFLIPQVSQRFKEWQGINSIYASVEFVVRQHVASISDSSPKTFLCLQRMLSVTSITQAADFDDLPFELVHEAIKLVKALYLDKNGDAMKIIFLLTGVWKPGNDKARCTVLPWSPFLDTLAGVKHADLEKVALQIVFDRLVPSILALDEKARPLLRKKWPTRCVQFMAIGFCSRKRNGEECFKEHELIHENDCARLLGDLLQINSIFCDLAAVYYRRVLDESFQEKYLKIRRHWLEKLLRQTTYLSSVEQSTAAILTTQEKLLQDHRLLTVSCFIEELLYHRLRSEWERRNGFTSLMEQIQMAEIFGYNVQKRVFRAISQRLFYDRRSLLQRHLFLSTSLTQDLGKWNPSIFQQNLTTFLLNLENIDVGALSSLHSLTAMFEHVAAYLILKTCNTACILPNSWIDLHVKSITKSTNLSERPKDDDKYRFSSCIIQLAKGYYRILSRFEHTAQSPELLCSGQSHLPLLLRQRNAELVAIIVANMAVMSPEPPTGFNDIWAKAREIFEYQFIKAIHLRSRTTNELTQNLVSSFARYQGKDFLVLVIESRKKSSPLFNLEHHPDVKSAAFEQLCPPLTSVPALALAPSQTDKDTSPTSSPDSPQDQYSTSEIEAMTKIQRLWRPVSEKLRKRRAYVSVPEYRATVRLFNLGAHCPKSPTTSVAEHRVIRKNLVRRGVPLLLRLDDAKGLLSQLQEDMMKCIQEIDLGEGVDDKSVDDILCRNRDVEAELRKASEYLSDGSVVEVVKMGDLSELKKGMDDVMSIIKTAEECLGESRRMMNRVSRKQS